MDYSMKKIFVSALLSVTIPAILHAQSKQRVGVVDRIQGNEIFIKYDNVHKPLGINEKLHVKLDNETVTMTVTYPMQTYAKCKLEQKFTGRISQIAKGQIAFKETASDKKTTEAFANNSIFTDNGDGTITDNRFGLMWLKDANTAGKNMSWGNAVEYCSKLDTNGYYDWRLPSREEFESFVSVYKRGQDFRPFLSDYGFTNIQANYWSSTSMTLFDSANAFYMRMDKGLMTAAVKLYNFSIWPVRTVKK
jgi:hypothetical protein